MIEVPARPPAVARALERCRARVAAGAVWGGAYLAERDGLPPPERDLLSQWITIEAAGGWAAWCALLAQSAAQSELSERYTELANRAWVNLRHLATRSHEGNLMYSAEGLWLAAEVERRAALGIETADRDLLLILGRLFTPERLAECRALARRQLLKEAS